MPRFTLGDLLAALAQAVSQAQVQTHLVARDHITLYAQDKLLRTFNVPNFEYETIAIDVPLAPEEVVDAAGARRQGLSYAVTIKRTALPEARRTGAATAIQRALGWSSTDAQRVIEHTMTRDVMVLVTTDDAYARRTVSTLRAAGLSVSSERQTVTLRAKDLIVSTDLGDRTPVTLRVVIKPTPFRLIRDAEGPGETYLLQAGG